MTLVNMFPHLCSHTMLKEVVSHQVKHPLETQMAILYCGTLWGQSPCVQPVGPVGIGPFGIPLAGFFYTECPTSVWGDCTCGAVWSSGGSVSLSWHWPRVLSSRLTITRPRTGSAHCAWCQLCIVMQVTFGLLGPGKHRLQLYASVGLCGALKGGLLLRSHCCCSDLEMGVWGIGHEPQARTPLTGHLHQY